MIGTFIKELTFEGSYKIYLDQIYVGNSNQQILSKLQKLKRKYNSIGYSVSNNNIEIRSSAGRILKPVYNLKKINLLSPQDTLDQLIQKGLLCYLDCQEESASVITSFNEFDLSANYSEVNPSSYLSYLASSLPFISSNAAHRATLSLRLSDQALGSKINKDKFEKGEPKSEFLIKTDPSIIRTAQEEHFEQCLGQNTIIGFYHYEVEEDSVSLNRSAVERGLFDSMMIRVISKQSLKKDAQKYNYQVESTESNLESDYLPKIGSTVDNQTILNLDQKNDVLRLTKVKSPPTFFDLEDLTLYAQEGQSCSIDFKFSKLQKIGVGDKLGTRAGLKGVISDLKSELDSWLPENGVNPSLYLSTHVINSRMIVGPLMEVLFSKAYVINGQVLKVPCFLEKEETENLHLKVKSILENASMDPRGYEAGYDLATNARSLITMGPTKTLLLEHHARHKAYIRTDKGGTSILTRHLAPMSPILESLPLLVMVSLGPWQ